MFGKFTGKTKDGLNYNLPYPIGSVLKLARHRLQGDRHRLPDNPAIAPPGPLTSDVPEESLMLTGDENIADVKFRVIWQIDPTRSPRITPSTSPIRRRR